MLFRDYSVAKTVVGVEDDFIDKKFKHQPISWEIGEIFNLICVDIEF